MESYSKNLLNVSQGKFSLTVAVPIFPANHHQTVNMISWRQMQLQVVARKNNRRRRHVKEAVRINQSSHVMNWYQGHYNLSNIYRPLFSTRNYCSGTLFNSRNQWWHEKHVMSRGQRYSLIIVLDENRNSRCKWKFPWDMLNAYLK